MALNDLIKNLIREGVIVTTLAVSAYGCESDNNDVYKSACHELVATCNHDSECTAWAKAMIDEKDYSYCSKLKSQCQCH